MPRRSHWLDMTYAGLAFMAYLLMIGFAASDVRTWGYTHTVVTASNATPWPADRAQHLAMPAMPRSPERGGL